MNLEDRIRSQGKAKMDTFTPSPDLDDRIVTTTNRRIRQRQQRARAGLAAGVAAIAIGGIVLVNRPNTDVTIIPTTDPVTVTTVSPPGTDPGATSTPSVLTPPPAAVAGSDRYFEVDFAATPTMATERLLDGTEVRSFTVGVRHERATMADGSVVQLGDPALDVGTSRWPDPCTNSSLLDSTTKELPFIASGLTAARHIAVAEGTLYGVRDVCPEGTTWGDTGTAWELFLLTTDGSPVQTLYREAASFHPRFESPNSPTEMHVSPDGSWILTSAQYGEGFEWTARHAANGFQALKLPDSCLKLVQPAVIDSTHLAIGCMAAEEDFSFRVMVVDSSASVVWSTIVPGGATVGSHLSLAALPTDAASAVIIASRSQGSDPDVKPIVSRIDASGSTDLATADGNVRLAWTLAELRVEEASGDSVAEQPDPGNDVPTLAISNLPDGSVDKVLITDANGSVSEQAIPVDASVGQLYDAAVGPFDVLYVSQIDDPIVAESIVPYTVIAYRFVDGQFQEAQRWPMKWSCADCTLPVIGPDGVNRVGGFDDGPIPLLGTS